LRKDTPPQNTPFQIHAISELMFFKNVRKWKITFFERWAKFSLSGWTAHWVDGYRRILLGNNIILGQSCRTPSVSSVLELGFRLDSFA
jgi:hypothetical protein